MKTIYQIEGASLTFLESAEALSIVEDHIFTQSAKTIEAMKSRGFAEESTETASVVLKTKLHTMRAIANAMPSVFTLSLTNSGERMLSI